jgi:hypothetical protein
MSISRMSRGGDRRPSCSARMRHEGSPATSPSCRSCCANKNSPDYMKQPGPSVWEFGTMNSSRTLTERRSRPLVPGSDHPRYTQRTIASWLDCTPSRIARLRKWAQRGFQGTPFDKNNKPDKRSPRRWCRRMFSMAFVIRCACNLDICNTCKSTQSVAPQPSCSAKTRREGSRRTLRSCRSWCASLISFSRLRSCSPYARAMGGKICREPG